jgi:hypothetical protein
MVVLFFSPVAKAGEISVIESEAGFYYTVQKGDTLWDLSQQFNNSAWLWPELWEENDQISNPHWIFPGERIRLYKKGDRQRLAGTDAVPPVAATPASDALPAVAETETARPYFIYAPINSVGFIRKPAVAPLGSIFEVQGRKVLISEGDIVYIRPSADAPAAQLIPGAQHTVFRYEQPTPDRDSTQTIGTQHVILGVVEVVKKEPDMLIAKVVKSFRDIRVDDLLMPFHPQSPRVTLIPSTPGIDGQIIVSERHTDLIGDHMLAFMDKGRDDNIQVGQQYSLYEKQKTVLANNEIGIKALPPVDIGTCLVLHTEQNTSTVVITNAVKAIAPGERLRTPIH